MSADDQFYLIVGIIVVLGLILYPIHLALKKFFGIDMVVEFYAAQAELVGAWYDRKERREAAANRGRALVGHSSKRKD